MAYTLQLDRESGSTRAGFVFGANDSRLMDRKQEYLQYPKSRKRELYRVRAGHFEGRWQRHRPGPAQYLPGGVSPGRQGECSLQGLRDPRIIDK